MIPFHVDEMSVEEKLQAMEILWDNLCQHEDDVPSPPWHEQVLQEREGALARGEDVLEDWEVAKRRIRGGLG